MHTDSRKNATYCSLSSVKLLVLDSWEDSFLEENDRFGEGYTWPSRQIDRLEKVVKMGAQAWQYFGKYKSQTGDIWQDKKYH